MATSCLKIWLPWFAVLSDSFKFSFFIAARAFNWLVIKHSVVLLWCAVLAEAENFLPVSLASRAPTHAQMCVPYTHELKRTEKWIWKSPAQRSIIKLRFLPPEVFGKAFASFMCSLLFFGVLTNLWWWRWHSIADKLLGFLLSWPNIWQIQRNHYHRRQWPTWWARGFWSWLTQ